MSRRPAKKPEKKARALREPRQERSSRRREEILEATGRLLDRVGYEGTTTTAIAKEAGTAVGTVYEYFHDREALVRALLERYRERLSTAVQGVLSGDLTAWRPIAERAVKTFSDFYQREPGYRVLWLESQTTPALREAGSAWGDDFGKLLEGAFGSIAPGMPPKRRAAVARTCIHLVAGLTSMALTGPKELKAPVLEEATVALVSYLERVFEA